MEVDLFAHTQTSYLSGGAANTPQKLIAYCARVSNPGNQHNYETADKLINYLIKHKHWSPFEMVNLVFDITTTRDIARQLLRHRSFSFQEYSQRYADPTKDLKFVLREARLQDITNRQNSLTVVDNDHLIRTWNDLQRALIADVKETYEWAIDNGIAKEQARAILPEGLIESRLFVNGTIRSWIHYIEIRSGIETQREHRELAIAIAKAIGKLFPMEQFVHGHEEASD